MSAGSITAARGEPRAVPGARLAARLWSRLGPAGVVALGFLLLVALVAILAPVVAPYPPQEQDLTAIYQEPSAQHLLGTDATGRDLLSRLIWGARTSLVGPILIVGLAMTVAVPLAIASAWRGGVADLAASRFIDLLFAFPGVLLAILAVAIYGVGLTPAVLALAIAYVPWYARVTRSAAVKEIAQPYVEACRVQGFGGVHICRRHVLPNIADVIVAQATIGLGYALADLAALSFLGLAIQPPSADWGVLVSSSDAILQGHPEQALYAGALIVASIVSLTIIGRRFERDGSIELEGQA